jgi:recombination protein RecA
VSQGTAEAGVSDVDSVVAALNKRFGDGTIMRLGDATRMNVSTISTGSLAIDLALGVGGLPLGRICEIYGPEASGKTTFCLSLIAEIQKNGGRAVFIDVEHSLDPRYAKVVGVDLAAMMVSQPKSGEEALQIMETLVRTNGIGLAVLDSVAALVPKAELEGQIGDLSIGAQARLMSQALRKITAAASSSNCCCVFTNQIREKVGVMFGSPETTPGGRALKYFASVRMDIRKIGQIKDGSGRIVGSRTRLKVVKNKVAPPFTECEFDILYREGISKNGSLVDLGLELKILERKGAWISYGGNLIGQGRDAAKQFLLENPDKAEEIGEAIRKMAHISAGALIAVAGGEEGAMEQ